MRTNIEFPVLRPGLARAMYRTAQRFEAAEMAAGMWMVFANAVSLAAGERNLQTLADGMEHAELVLAACVHGCAAAKGFLYAAAEHAAMPDVPPQPAMTH